MAEPQREIQPNAGAESGTNRSPEHFQRSPGHHNTVPEPAAHVGTPTTRTPSGTNQGISNRSVAVEDEGQEKVVRDRPDVQGGSILTGASEQFSSHLGAPSFSLATANERVGTGC